MIRVVSQTTPCFCSVCDEPDALLVKWSHEKPGFTHLSGQWALCDKHAQQLSAVLTQRLGARRRARAKA